MEDPVTPHQARAVALIAAGETQAATAAAVGVSQSTIFTWLQKPAVRALLTRTREMHEAAVLDAARDAARECAEPLRVAQEKIARFLPEGVDIVIAIMRDVANEPRDRLRAFAVLADRGGLRPGAEMRARDEYQEMPLDELERLVAAQMAERRVGA